MSQKTVKLQKQRKYANLKLQNNARNLQVYSNLQHQCLNQNLTDNEMQRDPVL